jgi:tRNA1(Val) A37 N6-methylase TrmN6
MDTTLDSVRDISLYQPRNGYRFSVDALLLYSFVNLPRVERVADLGAGSGIIGLLLARKYPKADVALLELQEGLADLATANVKLNGLSGRVDVVRCDIRNVPRDNPAPMILPAGTFDLVVSNPPFRREGTGLTSAWLEKSVARHELVLTLPALAACAGNLLRAKGRFLLIFLPERVFELSETLRGKGFEVKRLRFVHSHPSSGAKMALVEAVKDGRPGLKVESPVFIYGEDGAYSFEMMRLYSESPVM